MNKPKPLTPPNDIINPNKNSDEETVPNGKKSYEGKSSSTPIISGNKIQKWKGITIEKTWYDALHNISKENDTKNPNHPTIMEELEEHSKQSLSMVKIANSKK